MRTEHDSTDAGIHAVCKRCGVAWQEGPDQSISSPRGTIYPGGLTLVPDEVNRPRTALLWTLGEWRCERDGLTVRLYRRDYLANALTVPDDRHVRECATQWLAAVPSARHARATRRHLRRKH